MKFCVDDLIALISENIKLTLNKMIDLPASAFQVRMLFEPPLPSKTKHP